MAEGRSFTTKFSADTSGFKKGMDEMIDKLNALNKKLVDNQYSQRDCNKTISEAKKKLKELQETVAKNGKATEDEEKQMRELNSTIEEQTLRLSQLRTEQASIRNLISETTRTLTDNNDQWTVLKGTLANLASDTLKKLGSALKNTVSDVIQTGEQFTAAISKVGAISGATAEELQQLEDAARLYGSTTMYSAKEAADALQYMALAGWNTEQSIEGLPSVLNLAASSGMDLGRASDIVTDYITAFGLSVDDAARFVDIMSYAMSHSNTTTEMLGEAYKNCAATARSMGFSVEEVTAALMTMANAGVKGGEAGTTLNTLMTRLATDTKGCATALEEYGVEIYDAQGTMKSLSEILSGMVSVWDTLTQKQQANLSKAIAGTNQYAGFQTLMQGMSQAAKDAGMSFEDYTAALEECSGTASKMSAAMTDNLTGDLKATQSAMDELKLKIFEDAEQPLRNIVQWITKSGIPALEGLVKNIDKIIPVVVAATAAMVSYKAALAVESIIKGVKDGLAALRAARIADTAATEAETAAQTALNTTQAANPIGLLVGAIGGLAAGLATVAAMTNQATESTKNYNEALDELLKKQSEAEADAAAEGAEVKLLQSEYDRLRQETDLTTREKERLNTVCEQLAGKLGLTTEELRTQEGAYRDLTVEVDKYIEKLKEQAKYEYYESIIKESTKAAAQIEADLEAAEKARQAWFDGNVETYLEMVKILQDQGHSIDQLSGFVTLYALIDQLNGQLEKAHDAADRATEAYYRLGDAVPKFGSVIGSLIGDLKDGTQNTEDYTNAITDAEKKLEELAKGIKAFQSQSTSLRSEMNSLANSLKQLESGEALSLNTLLDLIDKYPEYASELLAARDNIDLQRQALEHLFEAKKNDYILTQQAAIDNIKASQDETKVRLENIQKLMSAYQDLGSVMVNVGGMLVPVKNASVPSNPLSSLAHNPIFGDFFQNAVNNSFQTELDAFDKQIADYEKRIDLIRNLKASDFVTTSGGTSGTAKSAGSTADKKNTLTSPHTWNYKGETYTAEYSYTEGEYDAVRDADTNAKAYLGVLDRVKNFGKLTLGEEISNLQTILKWEKLSGDQRYEIRLRLYKAETELAKKTAEAEEAADKEAADRAKKAADEAAQALLERQNMALAAYNKLVNGRIEALEAESQAAQDNADKQIAAIDAVMKKRREESEDAKRQQELDQINAKLKYQQLDEFERLSLERRRQDILNEQTEVRYERMMEGRKAMITGTAEAIQNKNAQAIAGLQASQTQAADRVAYLQGSQTYDQRVKNNSVTQNVTIVQNGLGGDQLINKLLNKLKKELGAV
jgi:TP901 family phage tail tape measure protein